MTTPNNYAALDAWIDQHFDEEVRFLQALVRVPTDTPPGNNAPHAERTADLLQAFGMTAEKFDHILTLQTPDAEKCARADHVIDTGTSLAETRAQVRALVKNLQQSH